MRIDTKPYGSIEIEERQIIRFPDGLFGFEEHKEFALLDSEHKPFYWLQAVGEAEIAFVIIDPRVFRSEYQFDISKEDQDQLKINSTDDLLLFAIVTIPDDQSRMSANLKGPLLINRVHHLGKQAIAADQKWKTKHYIVEEMAHSGESAC